VTAVSVGHAGRSAQPGSDEPGRRLLEACLAPANLAVMALLGVGFIVLFADWFWTQHLLSWGDHDWQHAYMVPLISGYLLWQNRVGLARARFSTFWPGLAPMALGIVCYVFFMVGFPNHMGQGFAMILTLFGMVLLMLGPAAMEYLFFPVAYLIFGVTISEKIMIYVTFRLQHLAAEGAYALLNMIGVQTDLKGNTLFVTSRLGETKPLNIAEACSGMSMLIAFFALGAAMALVACRHWWQRVVLLMLAGPVALLLNVIRIAVLGVATLFDADLAAGDAHMLIGTLLLIPGFFAYLFIVWALNKSVEGVGLSGPGQRPVDA